MADVETKETKAVSTPEKKVVESEKEVKKDTPVKEVPKEVEEVEDEDSKASENGNGDVEESKENGVDEEKKSEEKEVETTNGKATNGTKKPTDDAADVCSIKRKSTGGDVTDDATAKDVVSPKKAKLDEKPAAVEAETNGA